MESLGTFMLHAKGHPCFVLASEFAARHRLLKFDSPATAGAAINAKLNIAKASFFSISANIDIRSDIFKAFAAYLVHVKITCCGYLTLLLISTRLIYTQIDCPHYILQYGW